MDRAPASIAFSTSSFTTDAGRSTTSPAAIWFTVAGSRMRIKELLMVVPSAVVKHLLQFCNLRKRLQGCHFIWVYLGEFFDDRALLAGILACPVVIDEQDLGIPLGAGARGNGTVHGLGEDLILPVRSLFLGCRRAVQREYRNFYRLHRG